MAGLSVINLGEVPKSGSTTFDATSIVQDLLGPLGPVCKLTAQAIGPLTAPIEQATAPVLGAVQGATGSSVAPQPGQQAPAPGSAPAAPGAAPQAGPAAPMPAFVAPMYGPTMPRFFPFALGRYQSGLPLYNYASLLVGTPGTLGRLSAGMLSPNLFGSTAASLGPQQQDAAANDVAAAGRATALPASESDQIALPVLVAVLMLAGVTAALIRSWVLVTRVEKGKA
jgi:hypothetical protein